MHLLDYILGRPLATQEDKQERVGPLAGVSVFGLDALSSAAYGPEAALTVLIGLGTAGLVYNVPITLAVCTILIVVYFSYRQTIAAYPSGAGSYTVAKENLGTKSGVFAAAALMIDYTLNVAVGISAGIGALTSAVPVLHSYALFLCLIILATLTFINLRGLRESGFAFMPPTYLFVGCLGIVILAGLFQLIAAGGHPRPATAPPAPMNGHHPADLWLLLKAFAAGCTAMTGVEAVSNGVQAFQEPVVNSARRTLTLIVAILIVLLLGIALLVPAYQITATDPGSPNYQSILSMLIAAVFGRGPFYYVAIAAILLVLCLSANTSFAGFPRVCRTVAQDGFLPHSFTIRGRRLVYTEGIVVLTTLSASLLILFNGVTDKLIPLFAIGAFLAFTLSQAGMVAHWLRSNKPNSRRNAVVNGIGAVATAITFLIVLVTKFAEGAWLVVIILPALCGFMFWIKHHYTKVARVLALTGPVKLAKALKIVAVVPIEDVNFITEEALQTAFRLTPDVKVVHIQEENSDQDFDRTWRERLKPEIQAAGLPMPEVIVFKSPYRKVISPVLSYIWQLERDHPDTAIAVLIPQLIESHWYYTFLHNQRATVLRTLLLLKGDNRIIIVDVPWHLKKQEKTKGPHRKEPRDRYPAGLDR